MTPASPAQPGRGTEQVDFVEITPASRAAIQRGLAYLAQAQADDGSYGAERYGRHVGITAIAGLAFLADGHIPGRGRYGEHVRRCQDFILAHATESGLLAADTSHGPMYGHGYAALFLGEVYGMTGDPRVREVLLKAVRLIVDTQNHEGGWRYHPRPFDADISVTITQVMALRSARNAGLSVPKETIDRAITYVRQCQNPADGGFRYMLTAGGSAYPRSAAGVASLQYAGVYDDDAVTDGLDYLLRASRGLGARGGGHYYYGHYYAAQAMFLAGGAYWAEYFPQIREELLERQQADGSWSSNHGDSYGTAMSLIVLQIPNRLLPIFQR
ncbi:MAG: prenyltransferase/squalene oxidase repeat-containing protein [Planctomycetota bacterium]